MKRFVIDEWKTPLAMTAVILTICAITGANGGATVGIAFAVMAIQNGWERLREGDQRGSKEPTDEARSTGSR